MKVCGKYGTVSPCLSFNFIPAGYLLPFLQAGASQAEIEAAARAANAHDFIVALPDGYNSEVRSFASIFVSNGLLFLHLTAGFF